MRENVVLVDATGNMTGIMEKLQAHQMGLLHSAISVFVFNSKGQVLLQQRALSKYHSAGLWTNACCSHPRQGEAVSAAAHRRLDEEMGIDCEMEELFNFTYRHVFDNGLTEHEFDSVFAGVSDDVPNPDPGEVAAYRYATRTEILKDIVENPEIYTVWFKMIITRVLDIYPTVNLVTE